MRLKKLVISGFKSFADRTVLHFDDGITCIVGPNGCGKSNIADAFRWVLGEQSAKSMRGNKMPDVIFAGTTHRKPLNVAEVSLTLTDVQGSLPIDYEEVTITRRLHRSGESEYLLNGNLIRLKDLQSLFLDSGIGKNAFSIFEQGKLDQVISYSPIERRHIFEEAAGILRFLQRKREALKRLEQADQNLSRVKDIHQEVEQQITVLKDQAEKAKRFKENKALLEELEKASYVLRWNAFEKKWQEAEGRQKGGQDQLKEAQEALVKMHASHQQMKHSIQNDEKALKTKSEELFTLRGEREIHTREQKSTQQRLQEIQQKEKKLKRELEELYLSQDTRQQSLKNIQQTRKQIETDFADAEKKLTSQRDKVKLKEKEINQLRQDLQVKQQRHLKIVQQESQLGSEFKQNETRLENQLERKKILEERKNKAAEDQAQLAQLIKEKKEQLNQISSLVDSHKDRLEEHEEHLKAISRDIEAKQKELETTQRKNVEQKARQTALIRLREDHEGFSSGGKRLLQESQNPQSLLYQKIRPLYEFLNPNADVAEAVAMILSHYSQTLIVESQADFLQIIEWTQKHQVQDFSLLCMEWIRHLTSSTKKNKNPFLKGVEANDVSEYFLKHVEVLANCSEAMKGQELPQEMWISQGNLFCDTHRVFFSVKANANQLFLREAELKALEEEIEKRENTIQDLNQQHQKLIQQKGKIQLERAEIDKLLRRDEMKLVEINFGLQRCMADLEKVKNEQSQMNKDFTALDEQIEKLQSLLKQLQSQYSAIKQEVIKIQEELQFLEKDLEKQLGALRIQLQDQKEKDDHYQQLAENNKQLMHQLNVIEMQEKEFQKQDSRLKEELDDLEQLQQKMKEQEPRFHQSLETLELRLTQVSTFCSELEKKIDVQKNELEQLEQQGQAIQDQVRSHEGAINQLNIQAAQHRSGAQSLEHELLERYQLTMAEAKETVPLSKSLDQTEKQIRSLRQAIQGAGDINMASIEDLEKYQERHQFLQQQVGDMTNSKEELLAIINQLDGESRKLFRQTFDAIRANFQKNFQILFNGGEADLQFTESDNILEAGIEIIAKPPGKQMRSISLLSGGEKCLTAVALLFAIFEVKSAPFCILDEIDAPLDDTNVERFTNVVKHFVDRCQFLIITHNKRTMAIGDMIFGISMEEKGVSKLLSLEFAKEEAPEANLVS